MKNNKYKILVLSDLKENTNCILQNAVKLSKTIDADIDFFYAKKATEIVEIESPLTAIRTISDVCVKTEKQIKDLITPISKENAVNIKAAFGFGNVKNEIKNCINRSKPDVIVLGNRKQKVLSFIGDNITDFVLKIHTGPIMIVSDTVDFNPKKELSLDFLRNERQLMSV